jgi:multidrug transporter EmrE-like cation transporter
MKHWIFLSLAALMEAGWFLCIQAMNQLSFSAENLMNLSVFRGEQGFTALWSIGGYGILGVLNAWFFYRALKGIPASVAFAVWTGTALGAIVVLENVLHGISVSNAQAVCMLSIIFGVLGLKSLKD